MKLTQPFNCWMILATLLSCGQSTFAEYTEDPSKQEGCTIFDWNHEPAMMSAQNLSRIGAAHYCPLHSNETFQGANCTITAYGDQMFTLSDNVTSTYRASWANLVERTLSAENVTMPAPHFNDTIIATVEQTRILQPGQAGYIAFSAATFCYEGALRNCTGKVKEGTIGRFCAPIWSQRRDHTVVSGNYSVVTIDKDQVSSYPDPFKSQSRSGGVWSSEIRGDMLATGLAVSLFAVLLV
ncbi:hypothetical protein N7539_008962 [Penicillium diatomitis]|uniref:Uncharacterized protein n=1 Tax=Penicillium diatomitis TaxID=2819901 RepID=A0A9X0BJD2_9EURO|nr:uncharacterized protein N7539_008962 [Penicillium diatomitis]KAJ5469344.1 hypothetical protein N7539_008962 [Penicillium diatomitis]